MKDIILIRTSTYRQEVEEQMKETIEFQKHFSNNEYTVIGGKGASAIKLDEQYLFNLNQVYAAIENGDIECVYAWSVDRIGRNEEVLMHFKNFLIKHGINLRVKNPSLELMDANGKVNNGVEVAFALYAVMAKQEMQTKQDRFQRTKKANKKEGKFNGGKVMYGYKVVDHFFEVDDEDTAKNVRWIFDTYINQPVSVRWLAKKALEKGWFTNSLDTVEAFVNRMLKNKAYAGQHPYPAIVSEETFEEAKQKLADFRILPKVKYTETPYYLQGIIFDDTENETHRMRVKKSEVAYMSYTEAFSLSINNVDSLVVQVLNEVLQSINYNTLNEAIQERLTALQMRLSAIDGEIENVSRKEDELEERYYVDGTVKNFNGLMAKLRMKAATLQNEKSDIAIEVERLKKQVVTNDVDIYTLNDEQRREMVMKYVNRVYAKKLDKWQSRIAIEMGLLQTSATVIYDRKTKQYRLAQSPTWNDIKIVRDIKGRKRDFSKKKKTETNE